MLENKLRLWKSLLFAFIFCFIAIEYFYTDKFINYEVTRHNIIYSAPFFIVGGGIYLYRHVIHAFVSKYRWVMLLLCWGAVFVYWAMSPTGFLFVLLMSVLCGMWLCYAIGSNGRVLNNRAVHYISGISMEVYLCHMMAFRGVEMLHLSRLFNQPDLLYWSTCLLTLAFAVFFSHIVKYKVLPKIEPIVFKQK